MSETAKPAKLWESVEDDLDLDFDTERARVPGGWLYRVAHYGETPAAALAFVPDPVVESALSCLDAGQAIEPTSALHDELRAAVAKRGVRSDTSAAIHAAQAAYHELDLIGPDDVMEMVWSRIKNARVFLTALLGGRP